jgi:hypothetical protein
MSEASCVAETGFARTALSRSGWGIFSPFVAPTLVQCAGCQATVVTNGSPTGTASSGLAADSGSDVAPAGGQAVLCAKIDLFVCRGSVFF